MSETVRAGDAIGESVATAGRSVAHERGCLRCQRARRKVPSRRVLCARGWELLKLWRRARRRVPGASLVMGGDEPMQDGNGDSATVHLVARVDQLTLALDHVTRELAETWGPRLLELERDVGDLLRILRGRMSPTADAGDE
ncbi:MAG: hypothetical protein Q8Q14_03450 [Gemmatimonadales bacterium]|nr:hypothetical protein [Gemmatimonadales bacterium]